MTQIFNISQARIITAAPNLPLVTSTFDAGDEGWQLVRDGVAETPTYAGSGGNAGGQITTVTDSGTRVVWRAPAAFLGDLSAAYNGYLKFDLRAPTGGTAIVDNIDVLMQGGGLEMRFDRAYDPDTGWTRFVLPLYEGGDWRLTGAAANSQPSQAHFQTILANLTNIEIRAKYNDAPGTAGLDNVEIARLDPNPVMAGVFTSPAGNFSALNQNPDGTYTRRLTNGTVVAYDSAGLMTSVADRNGNTTAYAYNGSLQLTTITDPVGKVTTLAYGGDGKLETVTDPAGRVTTFMHDAAGDLVKIVDPDLSERDFAYDARHRMTTQTSKRDFVTTYDYGFHGRFEQANWPDGSTRMAIAAEVVGLVDPTSGQGTQANPAPVVRPGAVVATFTDGNGNVTTRSLDGFGQGLSSTDALLRMTTSERDANGQITRFTARNGRIDEFTYDNNGNVLTITEAVGDALQRQTAFEYEPVFNQVTKITDPAQNDTLFDYDANGNLTQLTDAAGTVTTFVYGDLNCPGQPTSATAAQGLAEEATTSFTYDPFSCNLAQILDPLGNPTSFAYDAAGSTITITDALSRETRFVFDAMNRAILTADPRNTDPSPACATLGVTCLAFDAAGNLTSVTDANGNVTDFAYDSRNRLTQRTDPLLASGILQYDPAGNLQFVTDRKGQVIELQYDVVNRISAQVIEPGSANEFIRSLKYDVENNLTSVTDSDSALTFSYDLLNRIVGADTTGSPLQLAVDLVYDYNANDRRVSLDDDLIGVTSYTYDNLNLLESLTPPAFVPIDLGYDALSRRTFERRGNSVDTTYTYDLASRLDTLTHAMGETMQAIFDYGVDAVGKRTSVAQQRDQLVVTGNISYSYDVTNQLTDATSQLPGGTDESYQYDALGNRTVSHLSTSHVTNAANRLLEDDTACYTYDANGNLTTKIAKVTGSCVGGITSYSWDAENRLERIDFPGGGFAEYHYDGLGRRIQKNINGALTRYVYDFEDILFEFDGTNSLTARYTHGPGLDEPLALQRDLNSNGSFGPNETFYYSRDGLGSIVALTNDAGTVVGEMAYDAFGAIAANTTAISTPYAFTGREFDQVSGLYYYRARYYDPEIGRFIQEDPVSFVSGINLYAYVGNNPISFVDPNGREAIPWEAGSFGRTVGDIFYDNLRDLQRSVVENAGQIDNLDTYYHCLANCQTSEQGAVQEALAEAASDFKECVDNLIENYGPIDSMVDQLANQNGRDFGRRNRQNPMQSTPCELACGNYVGPRL